VHITGLKIEEHMPLFSTDDSIALAAAQQWKCLLLGLKD
jgi:hypothetical protein